MIAYYSPGKDKNSVAQYLGIQPWQVERNIFPAMRNYSAAKVLSILSVIRDTDEKSKGFGGSKVANGDLLKQLVFFILHWSSSLCFAKFEQKKRQDFLEL